MGTNNENGQSLSHQGFNPGLFISREVLQDRNVFTLSVSSFRVLCFVVCVSLSLCLSLSHSLILSLLYREVPMKEAKEFAESIAAIFIETSARNAVNVEELFQKISRFPAFYSMLY